MWNAVFLSVMFSGFSMTFGSQVKCRQDIKMYRDLGLQVLNDSQMFKKAGHLKTDLTIALAVRENFVDRNNLIRQISNFSREIRKATKSVKREVVKYFFKTVRARLKLDGQSFMDSSGSLFYLQLVWEKTPVYLSIKFEGRDFIGVTAEVQRRTPSKQAVRILKNLMSKLNTP